MEETQDLNPEQDIETLREMGIGVVDAIEKPQSRIKDVQSKKSQRVPLWKRLRHLLFKF